MECEPDWLFACRSVDSVLDYKNSFIQAWHSFHHEMGHQNPMMHCLNSHVTWKMWLTLKSLSISFKQLGKMKLLKHVT